MKKVGAWGVAIAVAGSLIGVATPAHAADPVLYLPFPAGQSHQITQYPHVGQSQYNGNAMDIGMAYGDPVTASAPGRVVTAGTVNNADYSVNGNQVIIDHGNDFCTQYNHLQSVSVSVGQNVPQGQLLGGAGATGAASGPHLHWNKIYCSSLWSRDAITTAEYPGGFSNGMWITSRNYMISGAIGQRYNADGGQATYGSATMNEAAAGGGGRYQGFERAAIFWKSGIGAWAVRDSINTKWRSLGAENSYLGYPIMNEAPAGGGGAYQGFEGGTMFWSPSTGAHAVGGAIQSKWRNLGAERSFLGYPSTDEMCGIKNGGCYQGFTGGAIFWSPATGAYSVQGAIQTTWRNLGAENSVLGYPTTDEFTAANGDTAQNFQGGTIYWNAATGTRVVTS